MDPVTEDKIKEAFLKVKKDLSFLSSELLDLKRELTETRKEMVKICEIIETFASEIGKKELETPETPLLIPSALPAHKVKYPTLPTHSPAHDLSLKPLKPQILAVSTGNQGVPTDRQTDRQTDNSAQNYLKKPIFPQLETIKSPIEDAAKILDSLDSLKKEIRLKFKQLTEQELLVFSAIYQLEEELGQVEYRTLAKKLGLTESSIRDYIGRLLKKGIPVEKKKINNKQIQLGISQSLKKIASLSTILQLKDI